MEKNRLLARCRQLRVGMRIRSEAIPLLCLLLDDLDWRRFLSSASF